MNVVEIIIGIALLLMAVFLVAAILMQSGKDKRLSGAIAGAAETFFGKSKSQARDKVLSRITTVLSFVFVVLVVVMYIYMTK